MRPSSAAGGPADRVVVVGLHGVTLILALTAAVLVGIAATLVLIAQPFAEEKMRHIVESWASDARMLQSRQDELAANQRDIESRLRELQSVVERKPSGAFRYEGIGSDRMSARAVKPDGRPDAVFQLSIPPRAGRNLVRVKLYTTDTIGGSGGAYVWDTLERDALLLGVFDVQQPNALVREPARQLIKDLTFGADLTLACADTAWLATAWSRQLTVEVHLDDGRIYKQHVVIPRP